MHNLNIIQKLSVYAGITSPNLGQKKWDQLHVTSWLHVTTSRIYSHTWMLQFHRAKLPFCQGATLVLHFQHWKKCVWKTADIFHHDQQNNLYCFCSVSIFIPRGVELDKPGNCWKGPQKPITYFLNNTIWCSHRYLYLNNCLWKWNIWGLMGRV